MNDSSSPARATGPRVSVAVTCSGCGVATTVPFTPTPGRPVFCRDCFAKRSPAASAPAARPRMGGGGGGFRSRFDETPRHSTTRKRMMAQGRKTHFVYDAMEALSTVGTMPENERRAFIESVFSKGARMSTQVALEYVEEKRNEKLLTNEEANRLQRLVDQYSFWR